MKKLILIILFFISFESILLANISSDLIILKNGNKIIGTVLEIIPNVSYKIQTNKGSELILKSDEIEKISKEVVNSKKYGKYSEFGFTLGTPGYVNLNIGLSDKFLLYALSGGLFSNELYGAQFDLGMKLKDSEHFRLTVGPLVCYQISKSTSDKEKELLSFGLSTILNFYGFQVQLGCSKSGEELSPNIQFGYVYRFLD